MAMNPRLLRPLATGFSPKQIAGLGLWLDAADSSTVSLDGSGNVEAWADKSGNGRNATQTTAANRPDYAGTLNGKNVVGFAGSPEALTGTNPTPGATLRTVFSVWNPGSSGATRECVIDLGDTSASGQAFAITNEVAVRVVNGFAWFANNPISAPAVLTISLPSADAAAITGRLNGLAIGQTSNSAQAISSGAIYRVGDAVEGTAPTTYPLTGSVAEILVYSRVLTAAEVQKTERYLSSKWGIALA